MKRKSHCFAGKKPDVVVDWILSASDRGSQRKALAEKWLEEGQYQRYRYIVETCEDGKRIYLLRPTFLNKGFDFQVNLEGFKSATREAKGMTKEMPSHGDVIDDLQRKVKAAPKSKEELYYAVCDLYDCVEPDEILHKRPHLRKLSAGLPIDKVLRIIKWLFIEQDLTYWLETGRNMFMCGIENEVFGIESELHAP
jgi:hypothetical protein